MRTPAPTATPQTTMRALAATMLAERTDQVVIASGGRLVGVVTRADILRALVEGAAGSRGEGLAR